MIVVIVVVILAVLLVAGFVVWENRENRRALLERLDEQRRSLDERIGRIDGRLDKNLENTATRMKEIGEELRGMRDSATQILDVGRSISSLQDILRPPKLRGGLGELLLGRLLEQVLPKANYSFQHRFRSGEAVDATIDLGVALVPVDAKFPLESFTRMTAAESDGERSRLRREFVKVVKGHIDAVAKYIRPDEGTFDFALMYIPAEKVYYETIVKSAGELDGGIQEYALDCRVVPVLAQLLLRLPAGDRPRPERYAGGAAGTRDPGSLGTAGGRFRAVQGGVRGAGAPPHQRPQQVR